MSDHDQQMQGLFGEQPHFSEYKKGDKISFRAEGVTKTGTIVWVIPPGQPVQGGRSHGIVYMVDAGNGFPYMVNPGEVVLPNEDK